jgi:hypothetical protein
MGFSGVWSEDNFNEETNGLLQGVAGAEVKIKGTVFLVLVTFHS